MQYERARWCWMVLGACLAGAAACGWSAEQGGFDVQRDVVFTETAGKPLHADVYVPRGDGPFPGVLVVHGGAWMLGNKSQIRHVANALAEHGYTAVSIDYRLAPQFIFPAQIEDCKAAVRWMRTEAGKYKIDPERLGGFGYSAGGHLVALLATTDPSAGLEGPEAPAGAPSTRLQCVVAGGAPCEFRMLPADNTRLAYWLGGSRAQKPAAYERASPNSFVTKDDPPIFFYHGEADGLVPIASPQVMIKSLAEAGVPAELHTVPGAGHIGAFYDQRALEAAIKFLDLHLKAGGHSPAARAGELHSPSQSE